MFKSSLSHIIVTPTAFTFGPMAGPAPRTNFLYKQGKIPYT